MEEELTYDTALNKAEQMIAELEQKEALSQTEYKQKAEQIKRLLDFCEQQLSTLNFKL
ncbi:MAG: hypothetical protein IJS00_01260 [Paludibacteraceae bacterium]|nr:hypothetical protein [Paludibacteraceae bacterium]